MNLLYITLQLQSVLAVPVVGFVHQRNDGYASSQEPTTGTHHDSPHLTDGDI